MERRNKKAIAITGSSRGIGKFLALTFLRRGWFVYGCSRKKSDIIDKNYQHYVLDITYEKAIIKMFKYIKRSEHSLYALINNAGAASMNHALLTPGSTLDKLMQINFIGMANCRREASKIMMKNKEGRIINFSTIARPINLPGEAAYVASKAAVEAFSKTLAAEGADFGITVNVVGPNPVKTDLIKGVSEEKVQKVLDKQLLNRYGTYEDILNIIDFYTSPQSSMITAQILYLGGVSC